MDNKSKILQKLKELNSEFADSDMLVDFVLVMIDNKKPKEYILEQLSDLTTTEESEALTDYIFNELLTDKKDLREIIKERSRNIDSPRSPVRRRIQSRSRERSRERRVDRRDRDNGRPYRDRSRDRERDHPRFSQRDREQPRDRRRAYSNQKPITECRFREKCTKVDCPYSHPSPAALSMEAAFAKKSLPCRFFPNCLNPQCPFEHPKSSPAAGDAMAVDGLPEGTTQTANIEITGGLEKATNAMAPQAENVAVDPSKITCKFDGYCKRYGCHFFHPSRYMGATMSKNKVLIVNPSVGNAVAPKVGTSERTFALEGEVERVETNMDMDL